ncbi:MAG: DUF4105 domain-containing protein [Muribaculaceae bacterium]|nr:DUF4105 domain-containing protein [Muribaculaceae bacterium]
MKRILLSLTLLLVVAAMQARTPADDVPLRSDTTVWFITVGPGSQIYELEGHSAIAMVMPDGREVATNYGVFDFDAPNFVWRFVKGETDYMSVNVPLGYFTNSYAGSGRLIEAARLDLTPEQTARLAAILEHDTDPRFRTYRYNYVLDNCATRPLRAVEQAIGDSILLAPAPFEANSSVPVTFRNIMRHYHANYPWYQFGIDLALGSGIDRPVSRREAAFAPAELRYMLRGARVGDRPLVAETVVIAPETAGVATEGPTPWYAGPQAVCWLVFAIALWLSVNDIRHKRTTRWFDTLLYGTFGLAGLILTFLIFVSVHEATSPNWLYVWLNPFCFIAAVLVWIKRAGRVLICYHFINFVAVIALVLAWPWIPQSANAAFVPLVAADLLRSGCYLYIHRKRETTK